MVSGELSSGAALTPLTSKRSEMREAFDTLSLLAAEIRCPFFDFPDGDEMLIHY